MNIIFFTEISPFPVNGGEKIRVYGFLKALSELGHFTKLVCQNKDNYDFENMGIENVDVIQYKNSPPNLFQKCLSSFYIGTNSKVLDVIKYLILNQHVDVIFLDFFLAPRYIRTLKKYDIPIVISTHNAESHLIWQYPYHGVLSWLRKAENYCVVRLMEKLYYKYSTHLIAVSDSDGEFHSRFYPRRKISVIPNFLDEKIYVSSEIRDDYFIMPANFGAYMNVEGLKWFVNNVWNEDIDKKKRLLIVGRKSQEVFKEFKIAERFKNIKAIGEVDDTKPYIAKARAVLIPLLQGSGARLKCLEAMALKTPVIGTSKGVEGIHSKNIFIADSVTDFRRLLLTVDYSKSIGDALYDDFLQNYSLSVNKERINVLLKSLDQHSKSSNRRSI